MHNGQYSLNPNRGVRACSDLTSIPVHIHEDVYQVQKNDRNKWSYLDHVEHSWKICSSFKQHLRRRVFNVIELTVWNWNISSLKMLIKVAKYHGRPWKGRSKIPANNHEMHQNQRLLAALAAPNAAKSLSKSVTDESAASSEEAPEGLDWAPSVAFLRLCWYSKAAVLDVRAVANTLRKSDCLSGLGPCRTCSVRYSINNRLLINDFYSITCKIDKYLQRQMNAPKLYVEILTATEPVN